MIPPPSENTLGISFCPRVHPISNVSGRKTSAADQPTIKQTGSGTDVIKSEEREKRRSSEKRGVKETGRVIAGGFDPLNGRKLSERKKKKKIEFDYPEG